MSIKSFPSLHTHSYFSLLDGVPSPSAYFERCQELEMNHIAFTDHGSLGSLAEATIESKKFNVTPIMGIEGYIIPSVQKMNKARALSLGKEKMKKFSDPYHIILLVKNKIGFQNLTFLNNFAWTKGFYYKPKFDYSQLFK